MVATAPCRGLTVKDWVFWKNNPLILLPHTKGVASDMNINFNSRIYSLDLNYSLFEIFKYHTMSSSYALQYIGNTASSSFVKNAQYIWSRRSNLSDVNLQIIYGGYPPFIWEEKESQNVKGFYGEIFFALHEKLQFQYTLHRQRDNVWGAIQKNGLYTGLFGELQSGRINWSIADTTITQERAEAFDFSLPITEQHKKLITRKPLEEFNYSSYLMVFTSEFWIALIASIIILTLFMFLILFISSDQNEQKSNCLTKAFAFTTLSLFGRELFSFDTKLSGKIICLVIVMWGFLVSASYNAILTSVLASSTSVQSIDSLEDLLKSRAYTLILKSDGSTRDYFGKAKEGSTGKFLIDNC